MATWDFFVSYTKADRAWAEWVSWTLESEGLRVLVQAWDMTSGGNWVDLIDQGVRDADRTLALLSPDYLGSRWGKVEWQAAFARDPLADRRTLVVARVRPCERPGLLAQVQAIDLFGVDQAVARARLLGSVAAVADARLKPSLAPPFPPEAEDERLPRFPGTAPRVSNLPMRSPHFVGREELLDGLWAGFPVGADASIQTLRGPGGTGKTLLAIEYAHRRAADYEVIWWIPAEEATLVDDHLRVLGLRQGLGNQPDVASVVTQLSLTHRCLLILDNANRPEELDQLSLAGLKGHILVTTRRTGWGSWGSIVDVGTMERPEAVALLRRRISTASPEVATAIADALGDLPLALEQASAYLEQTALPPREYLELLDSRLADLLSRGTVRGHSATIASLWEVSLEQLNEVRADSVELLRVLSMLSPDPVPLDLFAVDKGPGFSLGTEVWDSLDFSEMVGSLAAYSLVTRDQDTVRTHRLTQAAVRAGLPPTDRQLYLDRALRLVARAFGSDGMGDGPAEWEKSQQVLPHLLFLVSLAPLNADNIEVALTAVHRAGRYLVRIGNPRLAMHLFTEVRSLLHPDDPAAGFLLSDLGAAHFEIGDFTGARSLMEEAIAHSRQHGEGEEVIAAALLGNLAEAVRAAGDATSALTLHERALELQQASLPADDDGIAYSLSNIAATLHDLGEFQRARSCVEQALAMTERLHGPQHPDMAVHLNNIVAILRRLESPLDALSFAERAYAVVRKAYRGDAGFSMIESRALENLAAVLDDLGRSEEALPIRQEVAERASEAYGEESVRTANAWRGLASTLRRLGRHADAARMARRLLARLEAAPEPDDVEIADCLASLALDLASSKGTGEALPFFERAVAVICDSGNSASARGFEAWQRSIMGLAGAYGHLDRYADAVPLLESLLGRASLGDTQPDPAELRAMLALAYTKAGEFSRAVPLLERDLRDAEMEFGPGHPRVVVALAKLGGCLGEVGRLSDARRILERCLSLPRDGVPPDTVVSALNNLGETQRKLGNIDEAEPLLRESVQMAESVFGSDDAELANLLNPLALLLVETGRPREAEPLLRRALNTTRGSYGSRHPDVSIRLFNLGMTLLELREPDKAEPILREAAEQARIWFSPEDGRIVNIERGLARVVIMRALARPVDAGPRPGNKKAQPKSTGGKKRKKRG